MHNTTYKSVHRISRLMTGIYPLKNIPKNCLASNTG